MEDSPSTVATIEEDKLEYKYSDNLYSMDNSFMALPPPPPIFNNRQNSIQSNNSKDNEIYSIFSNSNASNHSIADSVDSFDQFYNVTEYDLNQSLDSIPDSLIDNSSVSTFNSTANTTHPLSTAYLFYQVNYNFDGHNQNHAYSMNNLSANQPFSQSFENLNDSDYGLANSTGHTPNRVKYFKDGVSPLHKFNSDLNLSKINTNFGSVGTMTNPSSASTSTPVKMENPPMVPLATFRHNPPQFQSFSHPSGHPNQFAFNSPRRRTFPSEFDESNTPTTATNSLSTPNSNANSTSNSPLNTTTPSLGTIHGGLHNIPHIPPVSSADKPSKKYTRRRLLPRSKNGCWICRIKHLKCDENRPTCSSCVKFGIQCDYSAEKPLYVLDKNLRREKLIEITHIRKSNQKLKPKASKKKLRD